ncbi:MAG: hypothetical protein HC871_01395 [Rhizobiales bacterium]|nr:hypothetical protein [Hyphomicrobiales bacterium]
MLRALQMRMRMLWVDPAVIQADPAIGRYFNLTAGKSAAEAPDAFALLTEAAIRHRGEQVTLRNIERYLHQVEAENAATRPARKTARAPFHNAGTKRPSGPRGGPISTTANGARRSRSTDVPGRLDGRRHDDQGHLDRRGWRLAPCCR